MKIYNLLLASESKDDSGARSLAIYPDLRAGRFDDVQSRIRGSVMSFTDEEFAKCRLVKTPEDLEILYNAMRKNGKDDAILWRYDESDLHLVAYVTVSELVTDNVTVSDILSGEAFPIACLSRADLEARGFDTSKVSDADMRRLASKLGDDYCEQLFWSSLDILAGDFLGIPKKTPLQRMLPSDGTEVDISDDDDAPSWTFFDDDDNGYTDRATAVRMKDGKVEIKWEGERCHPACWEPLENIEDEDDYDDFVEMLALCVAAAL